MVTGKSPMVLTGSPKRCSSVGYSGLILNVEMVFEPALHANKYCRSRGVRTERRRGSFWLEVVTYVAHTLDTVLGGQGVRWDVFPSVPMDDTAAIATSGVEDGISNLTVRVDFCCYKLIRHFVVDEVECFHRNWLLLLPIGSRAFESHCSGLRWDCSLIENQLGYETVVCYLM